MLFGLFERRTKPRTAEDFVTQGRYGEAVELLRAQLAADPRNRRPRIQLADVLVLKGDKAAAVPLLLELGEEFASDGFLRKASALLKKADKLAPRQDIKTRIAQLAGERRQRVGRFAAARKRTPAAPVFGIEEISDPPPVPAARDGSLGGELLAIIARAQDHDK
jgi:thioredoxin-like negative regulator of GroEL